MSDFIEIIDFSAPELDVYARLTERQLLHYEFIKEGLFVAESPKVIVRALDAGYEPVSFLMEKKHTHAEEELALIARCGDIPVYTADYDVLIQLTGFMLTRGTLCAMKRNALPEPADILRNARRVAVLEDVMNPTNIGAIFRSAAALNMDAVLLTPACADPLYRRSARIMAIIGHLQTLACLGITTYAIYNQMIKAYNFGSMTEATYPIPQFVLYLIMFLGCILMLITVFFILLTLFTKSDEYIE